MKYCHCPNQYGKRIASDCEDCGGVVSNRIKSAEDEYWSLGCDVLAGPKNRAVKIATAQMPETAKAIAMAMNLSAENIDAADRVGRAEMAEAAMKADRDAERTVKNSVIKNYDIALEGKAVLKRERDEARSERDALKVALRMLRNAALKHKMDKDDLEIEDANALLGLASSSQREAAGLADEKPDGQAENADVEASPPNTPRLTP